MSELVWEPGLNMLLEVPAGAVEWVFLLRAVCMSVCPQLLPQSPGPKSVGGVLPSFRGVHVDAAFAATMLRTSLVRSVTCCLSRALFCVSWSTIRCIVSI